MPMAWAAIVIRVWSRVASAVRNPVPSGADHPVRGDGAVVEVQLPGRRALDAELVLGGAEGEPRIVLLHHERRDPARPGRRVGHGHHRVVLRHSGVRDPALGSVEDKTVTVADGAGRHRGRVRAGLRLGQRVGEHRLAPGDRRQVALLELLGPGQQQRHRAQLVHRRDQRRRGARPGDLLDHDRGGDRVRARAAVGLGDVHRGEVVLGQRLEHVPGELRGLVHLGGPRRDLVVGQVTDGLTERFMLLGERESRKVRAHYPIVGARRDEVRG